jgi:predicted HAD superfamily Cof-like phosphohydrolase
LLKMQRDVATMMTRWDQPIRYLPAMIEEPAERLLTGNLIASEVTELLRSLGFRHEGKFIFDPEAPTDLVEAADGVGDVLVVVLGAANRLGLDAEKTCFDEAHTTNMTKFWTDGSIHKRKSDLKVVKPPTFIKPDFAARIAAQGYLAMSASLPAPVVIDDDTVTI